MKTYWAGVENLQNQIFSLVGLLLFAVCLTIDKKWLLNTSWRMILGVTIVVLQLVDSIFTMARSQWQAGPLPFAHPGAG